jgi:thiamine biosynthesis protein ThiS
VKLTVNGQPRDHAGPPRLAALLEAMQADPGRVAVMINTDVVPRTQLQTTELHDGDRVEVLTYAGGG